MQQIFFIYKFPIFKNTKYKIFYFLLYYLSFSPFHSAVILNPSLANKTAEYVASLGTGEFLISYVCRIEKEIT